MRFQRSQRRSGNPRQPLYRQSPCRASGAKHGLAETLRGPLPKQPFPTAPRQPAVTGAVPGGVAPLQRPPTRMLPPHSEGQSATTLRLPIR
jgi:hypothetical protein